MNLNAPLLEYSNYQSRPTVKLVVVNELNEVLLFNSLLIGGGVEHDETLSSALSREAIEEAGITFTDATKLDQINHYREQTMLRYEVHGYVAKFVSQLKPSTDQKDEIGMPLEWVSLTDAITRLTINLKKYKHQRNEPKYYNTLTALKFLEQANILVKSGQK